MEPLDVKIGDRVFLNSHMGVVTSITQKGNAVIGMVDCDAIIVRLKDRAVLNFKGKYIADYNIRSEKEYVAYKKECDERNAEIERNVEVHIWKKISDLMHSNPVMGEATFNDLKSIVQEYKTYFE